MITKENFMTEIDRLKKLGVIDDVAIDIKKELEALIPYCDDVKELSDMVDNAIDLLNENAKLNSEDKNIDISDKKSDNSKRAHALLLKMRMSRAKLDGIDFPRSRRTGRRRRR